VTFFAISKSGVRVPSIDDVIVGDASRIIEQSGGEHCYKYSYHVIVKYLMLSGIDDAKMFGLLVRSKLADLDLQDWIDMSVYRKRANFRTMITPKNGVANSRFQVENKFVGWTGNCKESLITIDHKVLLGEEKLDTFSFESIYGSEFSQNNDDIEINDDLAELKPLDVYSALLKLRCKKSYGMIVL